MKSGVIEDLSLATIASSSEQKPQFFELARMLVYFKHIQRTIKKARRRVGGDGETLTVHRLDGFHGNQSDSGTRTAALV